MLSSMAHYVPATSDTWMQTVICSSLNKIKDLIICSGYNVYPRVIEDALIGLAMDAASNRVSDIVGREAIRLAALEMTRKSVDRLIAQAKTPASSLAPSRWLRCNSLFRTRRSARCVG